MGRQQNPLYENLMKPDEDWRLLPDTAERRRIQNRLAQRAYRRNMKTRTTEVDALRKRLQDLEEMGTQSLETEQSQDAVEDSQPGKRPDPNGSPEGISQQPCKIFKLSGSDSRRSGEHLRQNAHGWPVQPRTSPRCTAKFSQRPRSDPQQATTSTMSTLPLRSSPSLNQPQSAQQRMCPDDVYSGYILGRAWAPPTPQRTRSSTMPAGRSLPQTSIQPPMLPVQRSCVEDSYTYPSPQVSLDATSTGSGFGHMFHPNMPYMAMPATAEMEEPALNPCSVSQETYSTYLESSTSAVAGQNVPAITEMDVVMSEKPETPCRVRRSWPLSCPSMSSSSSPDGLTQPPRDVLSSDFVDLNPTSAARSCEAKATDFITLVAPTTSSSTPLPTNTNTNTGQTLLHLAAVQGHTEVLHLLLSQTSLDINSRDADNFTPLQRAVSVGRMESVKVLLMWGADVSA